MQPWFGGPRSNASRAAADLPPLTQEEMEATLDGSYAPRVRHRVVRLNRSDVAQDDAVPVDMKRGGSVSWTHRMPESVGEAETTSPSVRRTASLTLVGDIAFNIHASRFLIYTEMLSPLQNWIRWHLGVFVSTSPAITDDGVMITRALDLADKSYDWSKPIDDVIIVPAGTVWTTWLKNDLEDEFGETNFDIPNSITEVDEDLIFEPNTPRIQIYNAGNQLIGYDQLTVNEDGYPWTRPYADLAEVGNEHLYEPGTTMTVPGSLSPLLPTLPNVLRFTARSGPSLGNIEGNGIYTVKNESIGPASIDARSNYSVDPDVRALAEVVQVVTVDSENQTILEAIGDAQKQWYFAGGGERYEGHIGLNPRHSDQDVVGLVKPRLGQTDQLLSWIVTSWQFPFGEISNERVVMPITIERRV